MLTSGEASEKRGLFSHCPNVDVAGCGERDRSGYGGEKQRGSPGAGKNLSHALPAAAILLWRRRRRQHPGPRGVIPREFYTAPPGLEVWPWPRLWRDR